MAGGERREARHIDRDSGRVIVPPSEAKTGKPRLIYLVPDALEIVGRFAAAHPEGPIFRNARGGPWCKNSTSSALFRLRQRSGVSFCLYDLRHSYATHALQRGVDPITLAHLMGHVDTTMLAKVYANVALDAEYMQHAAMKAFDGAALPSVACIPPASQPGPLR